MRTPGLRAHSILLLASTHAVRGTPPQSPIFPHASRAPRRKGSPAVVADDQNLRPHPEPLASYARHHLARPSIHNRSEQSGDTIWRASRPPESEPFTNSPFRTHASTGRHAAPTTASEARTMDRTSPRVIDAHEIHATAGEKDRRRQPHLPTRATMLRASEIRIPAFLIPCSASQLMDRHYRGRVPPAARNAA
jgi:hypothetical protein